MLLLRYGHSLLEEARKDNEELLVINGLLPLLCNHVFLSLCLPLCISFLYSSFSEELVLKLKEEITVLRTECDRLEDNVTTCTHVIIIITLSFL